jgi:hypothetical protein
MPADHEPYETGYCKPPRDTQFKKGSSGNPTGRPKESPSLANALRKILSKKVTVVENGERRVISKEEAVLTQIVNKAVAGDLPSSRVLLGEMVKFGLVPASAGQARGRRSDEEVQDFARRIQEALRQMRKLDGYKD